jgi:predicted ATPase
MRQASSARSRTLRLSSDGSTLPWLITKLKLPEHARSFQRWIKLVQLALPLVRDIVPLIREDDRAAYFKVDYEGHYEVPSSSLSDGTLSILALTVLPYIDSPPGLITVEEPENGVHPKAIQAITEALGSVGKAQVWLSSHSPVLLANVKPENVLCLSQSAEGSVSAIPGAQHPGLVDWKGGVDLGTLFAAGVLS